MSQECNNTARFSAIEQEFLKGIEDGSPLITSLHLIREAMEKIWPNEVRIVKDFTDHGEKHCERLAKSAYNLIKAKKIECADLSEKEIYLLMAGIYLHDIGMQCDVVKFPEVKAQAEILGAHFDVEFTGQAANYYSEVEQISIRKNHNYLSAAWIHRGYNNRDIPFSSAFESIPSNLVSDLIDICKFHSNLSIDECPTRFNFYKTDRKKLVAAILRFSDELDVGEDRVSIETINSFQIRPENALYWWLHSRTIVDFNTPTSILLTIGLCPSDFEKYSSLVYAAYINKFREKNNSVLDILDEYGIPIIIDINSGIKKDEFVEPIPLEISKALTANFQGIQNHIQNSIIFEPPLSKELGAEIPLELMYNKKYEEAIVILKELLNTSEHKIDMLIALSSCYYNLCNYTEALKYIESALSINPESKGAKSNKACIYAEAGIETGSKAKLLIAKRIFCDLALEDPNWTNYYNLANTLSGLGDYKSAKDTYIISLKYNNKIAEIWKNLGSCYFHLDDHKKELVCFNKALSINPALTEALISKGVTLAEIFEKHEEALTLINRALELDKEIGFRWPYVWYWKANCDYKLGNYTDALDEIECGIRSNPNNIVPFLNMKANILYNLWRINTDFLDIARNFFEFRVEINEFDYAALNELALIYKAQDNESCALESVLRLLNKVSGLKNVIELKAVQDLEISFDNLMLLIENIDFYKSCRYTKPIDEYISRFYNPDILSKWEHFFWLVFGISFTEAVDKIRIYEDIYKEFWGFMVNENMARIKHFLYLISLCISNEYKAHPINEKIDLMSELELNLPMIGLLESSRQTGYLWGYISAENNDNLEESSYISEIDLCKWLDCLSELVFIASNRKLKLFTDKEITFILLASKHHL